MNRKPVGKWLQFLLLLVLLVACGAGEVMEEERATAVPTPMETPMPEIPFRVIAYVTGAVVPEVIPYDKLTHLNYAFLIPNADGTFVPLTNLWKLQKIVADAHAADVQVLISVGGWGWDAQFETLAADPATRAAFVQNLTDFVTENDLDGADVDWEYPDPGPSSQNFLALIQELRQAMPDKLLTTAVVAYGSTGDGVPAETFALFDFINIMTYDGPDHATMTQFEAGLEYWQRRGLPLEKTVMGLPFYGRPSEPLYRQIVAANPEAAYQDSIEWNGEINRYNGILTVQAKTRLALERASGIMFWTLEQDAEGELSLLGAIDAVVNEE